MEMMTYAMIHVLGETGVGWDTFTFFSNIAENIYDSDFELTRQGSGILPLQNYYISCVVTSFVAKTTVSTTRGRTGS